MILLFLNVITVIFNYYKFKIEVRIYFLIVTKYWVSGKASLVTDLDLAAASNQLQADDESCITFDNVADYSTSIVVKSENCSLKRQF